MGKRSKKESNPGDQPQEVPAWKTAENRAAALEYRMQNASYEEISAELNITPEQAQELVTEALDQRQVENLREGTRLRIERINLAINGVMAEVARGNETAIEKMMKLEAERARLQLQLTPDYKRLFHSRDLLALAGVEYIADDEKRPPGQQPHVPNEYFCTVVHNMAVIGYSNPQIAAALGMTKETLKKYYSHIIETARPVAVTELVTGIIHGAHKKLSKGDSTDARWVVERLGPPDLKPTWSTQRSSGQSPFDEGVAGQLKPGAASDDDGTIRIIGGLPPPPNEWAEPPGMNEAADAARAAMLDEMDEDGDSDDFGRAPGEDE